MAIDSEFPTAGCNPSNVECQYKGAKPLLHRRWRHGFAKGNDMHKDEKNDVEDVSSNDEPKKLKRLSAADLERVTGGIVDGDCYFAYKGKNECNGWKMQYDL